MIPRTLSSSGSVYLALLFYHPSRRQTKESVELGSKHDEAEQRALNVMSIICIIARLWEVPNVVFNYSFVHSAIWNDIIFMLKEGCADVRKLIFSVGFTCGVWGRRNEHARQMESMLYVRWSESVWERLRWTSVTNDALEQSNNIHSGSRMITFSGSWCICLEYKTNERVFLGEKMTKYAIPY